MEPRPPRPRNQQPTFPGAPGGPAIPPGAPAAYPYSPQSAPGVSGSPVAPPPVTLGGAQIEPRRQRKRRGILVGVLGFLAGLALLGALGWFLRDRILPPAQTGTPPAAIQVVPGSPVNGAPAAAGSPTPAPAIANLLATATPTSTPAPRATTSPPTNTPVPPTPATDGAAGGLEPLAETLPPAEALPQGLAEIDAGERSEGEVIASLAGGDPNIEAESEQLLNDWGWEGNAYRNFGPIDGIMTPDGLTAFNVSAHRFADADSADNALIYFSDRVVAAQGLGDIEIDPLGDAARMLAGAPDGAPIAVLYLREGNTMYRIGAAASVDAPGADPVAVLVAAGQAILGQ
jgi:hypothetical protein